MRTMPSASTNYNTEFCPVLVPLRLPSHVGRQWQAHHLSLTNQSQRHVSYIQSLERPLHSHCLNPSPQLCSLHDQSRIRSPPHPRISCLRRIGRSPPSKRHFSLVLETRSTPLPTSFSCPRDAKTTTPPTQQREFHDPIHIILWQAERQLRVSSWNWTVKRL